MEASEGVEMKIQKRVPQLFLDCIMCAGVSEGNQGACQGDYGSPLMYKDADSGKFIQIAIAGGGVGECGDGDYPGIFGRVDDPSIWYFIASTINPINPGGDVEIASP